MHRIVLLLLLSLLGLPTPTRAQWSIVQSNALQAGSAQGAASLAGRNIWLGGSILLKSTDQGATWFGNASWPRAIVAIHFYDENNGVISANDGVFRSTDGGQTWIKILGVFGARGVGYCGSPDNIIVAAGISFGELSVTTDGGKTWKTHPTHQWNHDVASSNTGIAYVMASPSSDPPSWVWRTTDFGASWTQLMPQLPYDIYSLAIDSCDPNIVYAMNEDYAGTDDGFSQVYQSTNAGDSWQVVTGEERLYFNGAIYVSSQAVYAPSLENGKGIRRSTDVGKTWIDIGGPGLPDDSRVFCSVNDSILIAVDDDGNIWRTTNAGGFLFPAVSRNVVASMLPTATTFDTVSMCDDTLFTNMYVLGSDCGSTLRVVSQKLNGSSLFAIHDSIESYNGEDSIRIGFVPSSLGIHNASLEVTLSDGTILSSTISASVKGQSKATLGSIDIQNDTIGGEVRIPIKFIGGDGRSTIEMLLRYDTGFLVYDGSFDLAGNRVDDVNYKVAGSTKIRIAPFELIAEEAMAYAVFKVYPNRVPCTSVTTDSMIAIGKFAQCLTLEPKQLTINVCSIDGCGVDRISELVRHGKLRTRLTVSPNPTEGSVKVYSDGVVGDAKYELIDVEGRIVRTATITIHSTPFDIDLSGLSSGSYVIRLTSSTDVLFGLLQKK